MCSQILSYTKKNKTLKKLELIDESIAKHKKSNAAFFDRFNLENLVEEIESITWTITRPALAYSLYSLKDLISVKEQNVTGGSAILNDYKAPFTATIYNSLKNAGAVNVFFANMDEFGMSGTGLDSNFGHVHNAFSEKHMIAGSSSGSAYLVASDLVDFAIGSDTGDSGRMPASNSHIFGFKPSYGTISRYGFFPFCSQFDTPAILSKDLNILANVFSVISHSDPKDLTTLKTTKDSYQKYLNKEFTRPIKIAIFNETFYSNAEGSQEITPVEKEFLKTLEILKRNKNIEIEWISFEPELLRLFSLIYMVVSYSESISNYGNLNGLLFPFKQDEESGKIKPIYVDQASSFEQSLTITRDKLGKVFKFRQILGMYFLDDKNYDEIYLQSKKLLTVINEKVKKLFENYDGVLAPTSPNAAEKIINHKISYSPHNIFNILLMANFCGLPSITMPWIFIQELPVGLHLCCQKNNDGMLFQIASLITKLI